MLPVVMLKYFRSSKLSANMELNKEDSDRIYIDGYCLSLKPFTPKFKKYILPTFLKSNMYVR